MYLHLLERDPNVVSFEVQPFRLHYLLDGEKAYYRPDILVVTANGTIHIKEIKPKRALDKQDLAKKINAITEAMTELGYPYEVIDEDSLGSKTHQENIRLLYSYASNRNNTETVDFILSEITDDEIPIEEILEISPFKECETLKTIYALIWHNIVETNLEKRISTTSTVKMVRQSND